MHFAKTKEHNHERYKKCKFGWAKTISLVIKLHMIVNSFFCQIVLLQTSLCDILSPSGVPRGGCWNQL